MPSQIMRAIWLSWAASSLWVSTVRWRTLWPVPSISPLAELGARFCPIETKIAWAVRACYRAAARASFVSEPLEADQVQEGSSRARDFR
jgi:hypothetical protein